MSTSAGRVNLWSNFTKSFRSRSNALDVTLCRVVGPKKAVKRSTSRLLAESSAPVLAEDAVIAFLLAFAMHRYRTECYRLYVFHQSGFLPEFSLIHLLAKILASWAKPS